MLLVLLLQSKDNTINSGLDLFGIQTPKRPYANCILSYAVTRRALFQIHFCKWNVYLRFHEDLD